MLNRFMLQVSAAMCLGAAVLTPTALGQCGTRSWVLGVNVPPLQGHALVYDSLRQRVFSFGGYNNNQGLLDETWSFDGTTWTHLTTASSPPACQEARNLAYDSGRDRVVKFSGLANQANYETWEFDGTNWSRRAILGPLIDSGMVMEYDAARQKTVLFGGNGLTGLSNQTWLWNGSSWTRAFPAHSPPGRTDHGMVYDTARQKIVMYGGFGGSGYTNDLWEWNGTDWTQITLPGPTEPLGGGLAYDTLRHYTHLCGTGQDLEGQNWTYDGTAWTLMTLPPNNVCGLGGAAQRMVYFASRDQMLTTFPTGTVGSGFSYSFVFGALSAPTAFEHPSDQVVPLHGTILVSAAFTCTPGTTYRWYFNNNPMTDFQNASGTVFGAASTSLMISGQTVTGARTGHYKCIATSPCGPAASNEAYVEVTCEPRTIEFQVEPTPASFTINTATGAFKITVNLLGHLQMLLDPACAAPGSPATRGSITMMDLHTDPAVVTVPGFFGGSITMNNARLQIDGTHGEAGPPGALQQFTPWTDSFTQTNNEPGLSGLLDYDTLGLHGTTNLASMTPNLVDWTVQLTPRGTYTLALPFTGDWPIDAGLGDANPTLTMVTTLHAHAVVCAPDLGRQGGIAGADGVLDNNDFIVYINYFFGFDARADLGQQGGIAGSDGMYDNNDFIVYINQFFTGCT